jgi:hypothetical protein
MTNSHHAKYRVLEIKRHGASVFITHKDGSEETWVGFYDRDQAEAWIAKEVAKQSQGQIEKPAPDRKGLMA